MSERKPPRAALRFVLTRRDLLRGAPIAGLGACAAGVGLAGHEEEGTRVATGVCRICTMHCKLLATVRGDRLVRIEGDPASPMKGFICQHGYSLPEIVHAADRLKRPLKRDGNGFREIPWQQALAEIAERLRAIKREHGAHALAVHSGWPFVRHPLVGFLQRFCHAFGTPNYSSVASLCEAAQRMGKALTVGAGYFPDLPRTRTLVVWGANPPVSMPPFAHHVAAKATGGRNLIVIDPIRTDLAEQATIFLQVLPATDGALALGMLRLLLREGLHDRSAAEEAIGWNELTTLVEPWTLERTAQVTTVAPELIERAVRQMATDTPTAIWDGLGLEHHASGLQTVRAVAVLQALVGGVGAVGGVSLFARAGPRYKSEPLPGLYQPMTPEPVPPTPERRPIGYDEYPLYEVFNRQAQGNLYPRAILEGTPYPLRALVLVGCNAAVTWPGADRLREALGKLKLLVSIDPFLTVTGELADYVLPATTFAESSQPVSGRDAHSSLVRDQGEAWPDWKILFELARALGLENYFPWKTFHEALAAPRVPWMADPAHQPVPDPGVGEKPRFPTTSGKLEIKSGLLERFGADPLPDFKPPAVTTSADYPLWLVSGPRMRNYVNSQFHGVHSLAMNAPEPFVEIHPSAAWSAGVADGQRVAVVSSKGRIELRARVTDRVHPDVAVVPSGWAHANANRLTDGAALDPVTGFPAFRSMVCRVERIGKP